MKKLPPQNPLSPLLEKIRRLPPPQQAQVADFVECLTHRRPDRQLLKATAKLSESAFRKVWDNDEDAAYDLL